ncbi:MAG: GntR family transcriptional regulator [Clostridia bacterium]|nr:GntR family transcriptional regulator [Clostridia bacterium]
MNMIIDTYSMTPIYEQIVDSVKRMILSGELKENDILPSVRVLSRDLKISALTVKKAYDTLEEEGLTSTVHGKGTYVSAANRSLIQEERRRELEKDLEAVSEKAERYGVSREELIRMLEIITEEQTC